MKRIIGIAAAVVTAVMTTVNVHADYVSVVDADNPVGWWRFEDADTSNDSTAANSGASGVTNDGTFQGGVTTTSSYGNLGNAASLNGSSTYIDLGHGLRDSLDGASAVTIEAWVNNDLLPGNDGNNATHSIFYTFLTGTGTGARLAITETSGAEMNAGGRAAPGESWQSGGASYSDTGSWHHVVAVMNYAGDKVDVYVDGNLTSTAAAFDSTAYDSGTLESSIDSIGAFDDSSTMERFFDGLVDEVAIYDYDLGQTKVLEHFNAAIPEPTTLALLGAALLPLLVRRRR